MIHNDLNLPPLPAEAKAVFATQKVSPRLVAHARIVCDVACTLLADLCEKWEDFRADCDLVLFGATTHDIGKCVHPNELYEEGHKHEAAGKSLLLSRGIGEEKARFAETHASWSETSSIEELLVSLADKIWKGSRVQELEDLLTAKIAAQTGRVAWEVFPALDEIIQNIAKDSDDRLSYQNQFA